MVGARGDQLWQPIWSLLVAIYKFLGMADLMKGSVWVLSMKRAWDDGCSGRLTVAAYSVPSSGDL